MRTLKLLNWKLNGPVKEICIVPYGTKTTKADFKGLN